MSIVIYFAVEDEYSSFRLATKPLGVTTGVHHCRSYLHAYYIVRRALVSEGVI